MLKNILTVTGTHQLSKDEQKSVIAGAGCNDYCNSFNFSTCPPPPYDHTVMFHPCCLLLVGEDVC